MSCNEQAVGTRSLGKYLFFRKSKRSYPASPGSPPLNYKGVTSLGLKTYL